MDISVVFSYISIGKVDFVKDLDLFFVEDVRLRIQDLLEKVIDVVKILFELI